MTAETLKPGSAAPAFALLDADGVKVQLKDFRGKWVVVYFYPRDNTPGCTVEAIQFTAAQSRFEKCGAVVLGVSPDSCESHQKFSRKQKLSVRLLSDPDHEMLEKYGAWKPKLLYGKSFLGVVRSTVLIDPDGKVAQVWPKVKADGHADEVLSKLNELSRI